MGLRVRVTVRVGLESPAVVREGKVTVTVRVRVWVSVRVTVRVWVRASGLG